jgi:hypothetical protein
MFLKEHFARTIQVFLKEHLTDWLSSSRAGCEVFLQKHFV